METEKIKFQKLTPIRNADLKIYEEAINFVFDESDLKNIAITGPYSAGKSSVIESYKEKYPKKKFLNISLAHFDSTEKKDESDTSKEKQIQDSTLEGKILNQLIHQIDPERIPNTNFKVKRTISKSNIIFTACLLVISLILFLFILNFNAWKKFVQGSSDSFFRQTLAFSTNEVVVFVSGIICTITLIYLTVKVIKMIRYNKLIFKKLKVQGSEIELFEEVKESYFDKYLNEVLYLFINAEADAIIFEDMDRFNNNQIFEKLREINCLINKKSKRIIRFFYLLRDDTFVSKDRTKFFEFIIPIVPVVDGSNSYDQFLSHFKSAELLKKFDQHFLQGLSLYIDDMRILKNIYNEFVIYHERIQSTELSNDKLLAIITYKNIFPRDFSELQLGRGYVFSLFQNKDYIINLRLSKMEDNVLEMEKEIETINNELCNDLDELDAIYLITGPYGISVNGRRENSFSTRSALIKAMKENPDNIFQQSPHGQQQFAFQQTYDNLTTIPEYLERKSVIEKKTTISVETIKNEIIKVRIEMSLLKNRKLSELITKDNINEIFGVSHINEVGEVTSYNDVKASPYLLLIKYLLRYGYIDESYPDYMTYFYENSISRVDKIFLRSVTDEAAKEFTYELKDPAHVLQRLVETDFDKEEILNFNLLRHLLKTRNPFLNRIILQLTTKSRFDFIAQFYCRGEEIPEFIETVNHAWPNIIKGILDGTDFSDTLKHQYIVDSFYYSSDAIILSNNNEHLLNKYISSKKDFLNIGNPDILKIIGKLKILSVKFEQIDFERSNRLLFEEMYKAELYSLNYFMISLILEQIYGLPYNEDFKHKNYTLVLTKPHEHLTTYVRKSINKYMDIILEICDSKIEDTEEAALELINNPEIDNGKIIAYIKNLVVQLECLHCVDSKELWPIIIEQQKVKYSVYNILQYYSHSKNLDEVLINFINSSEGFLDLDYEKLCVKYGTDECDSFFEEILKCNDVCDERYNNFIRCLDWTYTEFDFVGLSESKIRDLISEGIIEMNAQNLEFVREHYPTNIILFILKNMSTYATEVINESNFERRELIVILEQNDVSEEHKIKLLSFTSDPITLKDKQYSENVVLNILERNLEIHEFPYLYNNYGRFSNNIKTMISHISLENVEWIIDQKYEVAYNLLCNLLKSDQISMNLKDELLLNHLLALDLDQTITCLKMMEKIEILSLFVGKRPKVEKNRINEEMLNVFKMKGWIYGFDIEKSEPDFYRARGRKIS
ncbi:YobI family P-loop NTPase [Gorillibacterium sp. sgz5001074]|uniref:YobI family P-loop NTPase n=1 Tax=Gorillibacterium sp. sgz5001074 TaxID=3446695 RepID=UPI003F665C52